MNQHYFDVPFAFSGDVTAIPDPLQGGGTVSMTEGWNYNYQRDLTTDPLALPIDRSTMNWLFNQITVALQALQQTSVPEFILAAQNGGVAFSYAQGSEVLWSASGNAPFVKYVSLTANNTNTPSASDPTGATTGWQIVVDPIATSAQAAAGTNNASIMTPLTVAQQTALRALLAGNSSQVFNVANATANSHAMALGQFAASAGPSGSFQIPTPSGPVIINWGQLSATTASGGSGGVYESASTPLNFTTPYQNQCWGVFTTPMDVGGVGMQEQAWPSQPPGLNGFLYYLACRQANTPMTGFFIAIGK